MKFLFIILSLFSFTSPKAKNNNPADGILGRWETLTKNLIVEVFKDHDDYKARVIWFKIQMKKISLLIHGEMKRIRIKPCANANY